MNILFVSPWFPYPPNNGSRLRVFNLLRGLAESHDVTLLSFHRQPVDEADRQRLLALCRDVVLVPWNEYQPDSWRARVGFFSMKPRAIVDRFSQEMVDTLQQVQSREQFDVIIASEIGTASYSPYFGSAPAIFEDVELATLLEQYDQASSPAHRLRYGLTWVEHRRYMARLLAHYHACTVVSDIESEILIQAVKGEARRVEVVPNCVELSDYDLAPRPRRNDSLIFTGSFTYAPNYEAMCWFLEEVYPHVLEAIPNASLTITGDHADLPLPSLPGVKLTGFVDDIRPLVASSMASVAPIWTGSGTRLKILEAMALGAAVISTSKGAEGLAIRHNEHLLIADTPRAFAKALIAVLQNARLRQRLANNAYDLVSRRYNWSAVLPDFVQFVEDVAHDRRRER